MSAATEPRWYCVNNMGMATLCADKADAEDVARTCDIDFPRQSPHRAVQLVEVQSSRPDMADAYCGAREDLAEWKRRALEAEEKLRAESAASSRLVSELNAQNGPTHMGEPARQRQPMTSEQKTAIFQSRAGANDHGVPYLCCYREGFEHIVADIEVAHGIREKT